jgi:hypothetical protein
MWVLEKMVKLGTVWVGGIAFVPEYGSEQGPSGIALHLVPLDKNS